MPLIPFFIFALAFYAVIALQFDDPLSPEAKNLLELAEPEEQDDTFYFLLGLDALPSADPVSLGKAKVNYVLQYRRDNHAPYKRWSDLGFEYDSLDRPQHDLFCHWKEANCPTILTTADAKTLLEVTSGKNLTLQRYQTFMELPLFTATTVLDATSPLSPVGHLADGNRIITIRALLYSKEGKPEQALLLLEENIKLIRRQLAQKGSLRARRAFLYMLSENLDVFSYITAAHNRYHASNLPPMSESERAFDLVMAQSLAVAHAAFKVIDRSPAVFLHQPEQKEWWPGWAIRVFFKPNMTTNAVALQHLEFIQLSRIAPSEFSTTFWNFRASEVHTGHTRNASVKMWVDFVASSFPYKRFLNKAFYVSAKIDLINQIQKLGGVPEDLSELNNPLSSGSSPVWLSDDKTSICFEKTPENTKEHNQACLLVGKGDESTGA